MGSERVPERVPITSISRSWQLSAPGTWVAYSSTRPLLMSGSAVGVSGAHAYQRTVRDTQSCRRPHAWVRIKSSRKGLGSSRAAAALDGRFVCRSPAACMVAASRRGTALLGVVGPRPRGRCTRDLSTHFDGLARPLVGRSYFWSKLESTAFFFNVAHWLVVRIRRQIGCQWQTDHYL